MSEGYGNDGPGFSLGLKYVSFSEMTNPIVSNQPSGKLMYRLEYMLTVNSSSQGMYQFSGNAGNIYI